MTGVNELKPAVDATPAQWLLEHDGDWRTLCRYGPPRFAVFVRVAVDPGAAVVDGDGDALRLTLNVLAGHTETPTVVYAAVWEGWIGGAEVPAAPRILIPNRTMLLFVGDVQVMRYAPAVAWQIPGRVLQEPHLVWAEDRAWCVACEVDEEVEFTVGCSEEAAQALRKAMPGAVRRVGYGDPAPLYRDDR